MQATQVNNGGMIAKAAKGNGATKAITGTNTPKQQLRGILSSDVIRKQFDDVLKENAGAFIASIIDLFNSDTTLQQCEPGLVVMEALKAATLKLPINKQLGFAYIVPYRKNSSPIPQFQLGYKGMVQLAQRTGAYRFINADVVYEGEFVGRDKLSGKVDLTGQRTGDTVVGYFAYIETLNGFQKAIYWTSEEVRAHAKKYSKSFESSSSAWTSDFDAMALKTVIRALLSKYGIMSVEFQSALASEEVAALADGQIVGEVDFETLPSANIEQEQEAPAS